MVDVSDKTAISMPIKNMIGIIFLVASFVFAYAQITTRLTSLETKDELMSADLLKKELESMMHNRVNIDFLKDQVSKLQKDVEDLKDKVRNNGSN